MKRVFDAEKEETKIQPSDNAPVQSHLIGGSSCSCKETCGDKPLVLAISAAAMAAVIQ